MRLFENRTAAASELSRHLAYLRAESPIVLGLANDGVPIAAIIAETLDAPMDVLLIERLTAPDLPEHVVGAVDEHGRISMIKSTARWHHVKSQELIAPARAAFRQIQRRFAEVRAILPELPVRDRTVIIVSEAVTSGARMLGAVASVRDRGARKIVVTAPVGAENATWQLHDAADAVIIPHRPQSLDNMGRIYNQYSEVTDGVVMSTIRRWINSRPRDIGVVRTVVLKIEEGRPFPLWVELDLPPDVAEGGGPYPAVMFSHGFESNAHSTRSMAISQRLAKRGIVGVRFDYTGHGRSEGAIGDATDEQMLIDLHHVHQRIAKLKEVDESHIGLVGSGAGGMIALHYAAQVPGIQTLVIRGPVCGREVEAARRITSPTLLIHAEQDTALSESIEVLDRELGGAHQLLRITDSNRLFSDPVSRELMVGASVDWLVDQLTGLPFSEDRSPEVNVHVRSADTSDADARS